MEIGGYKNEYDGNNLLKKSTLNGVSSTYVYDGEGHRVQKATPAETVVFVYDAFGNLAAEYGSSPDAVSTAYLGVDHLGSTRVTMQADGTVLSRQDFLPFGESLGSTNGRSSTAFSAEAPRQQFTGKERDAETGMDYFGARYMSAPEVRFTSPDPLLNSGHPSDPQTWNRYTYVGNNPLRNVDPTGLYYFVNTCPEADVPCNAAFGDTVQNVRRAYAATQAAYKKAVDHGDTKAAEALKRTLDGLGAEGKNNERGQRVNISVKLDLSAPGETRFAEGTTSTINVVLNPGFSNGPEDAQAAVVHEGVHAGGITPGMPTWNEAVSREHDAYETQSYFSQSIGFFDVRSFGEGSDMSRNFTLWNPSWAKADAAKVSEMRTRGIDGAAQAGALASCAAGGCKK